MSVTSVRFSRNSGLVAGVVILTCVLSTAILATWLAPYDPYQQDLGHRLIDPAWYPGGSWAHPLGTDGYGRDYLSRLLYGARISLTIGVVTMIVSGIIGTTLGIIGGYFGGIADLIVNFFVTVRLSMPIILVALAVVALIGGSLTVVILVLGFLLWDRFAVVTRSVVQQIREQEYVTAAHAIGASTLRIVGRSVLPNIADQLVVIGTLEMAHAIILEAALSFLGLGVQPPLPSWGLMIAEGKTFMFFKPWLIAFPGVALFLLVLAINLVGDGIRDVTSPRRVAH
ncbi:MAG TPA: ABC transporter permease [Candidatus Acidoferrales bacterium]|nr:ABC transporter permease [Candidatus Acidoferrales bacterium]